MSLSRKRRTHPRVLSRRNKLRHAGADRSSVVLSPSSLLSSSIPPPGESCRLCGNFILSCSPVSKNQCLWRCFGLLSAFCAAFKEALQKYREPHLGQNRDECRHADRGQGWFPLPPIGGTAGARFCPNPPGQGFAGGLRHRAPWKGNQPFLRERLLAAHPAKPLLRPRYFCRASLRLGTLFAQCDSSNPCCVLTVV